MSSYTLIKPERVNKEEMPGKEEERAAADGSLQLKGKGSDDLASDFPSL